jgi:hypothetical protein
MFLWTETGTDTNKLTEQALEQGYLLSPGSLFSPNQLPSTRMRINIASMSIPASGTFWNGQCAESWYSYQRRHCYATSRLCLHILMLFRKIRRSVLHFCLTFTVFKHPF